MSSREESPDWLRCFQPPTTSMTALELSSDSERSYDGVKDDGADSDGPLSLRNSPEGVDDDDEVLKGSDATKASPSKKSKSKSSVKRKKFGDDVSPEKKTPNKSKRRKGDDDDDDDDDGEKKVAKKALNRSVMMLSSDSESSPGNSIEVKDEAKDVTLIDSDHESPLKKASKYKSTKKEPEGDILPSPKEKKKRIVKEEENGSDVEEARKEGAPEKQIDSHVSSARLPLMLPEKVHRTKALVECEGDSIDLGGDMGSVGRVMISDTLSGDQEMLLDLKGTIYKTTIIPSRTFCVVSFGQSEAKIEAIMNDFIQLKPHSNVFEAETMVEGTLDGFSFESDEEADKVSKPNQTNEDGEAKANGKTKGKSEKASGVARKRGKTGGAKSQPQKKVKKKAPASKKAKTKK